MKMTPVLMSDKRFEEIEKLVRQSFKNACLLYIDEIENIDLKTKYEKRRASIQKIRSGPSQG